MARKPKPRRPKNVVQAWKSDSARRAKHHRENDQRIPIMRANRAVGRQSAAAERRRLREEAQSSTQTAQTDNQHAHVESPPQELNHDPSRLPDPKPQRPAQVMLPAMDRVFTGSPSDYSSDSSSGLEATAEPAHIATTHSQTHDNQGQELQQASAATTVDKVEHMTRASVASTLSNTKVAGARNTAKKLKVTPSAAIRLAGHREIPHPHFRVHDLFASLRSTTRSPPPRINGADTVRAAYGDGPTSTAGTTAAHKGTGRERAEGGVDDNGEHSGGGVRL